MTPITEQELRTFCKGKISHQKIPHYFQSVDAYPMTASGKVQKFVLREQAIRAFDGCKRVQPSKGYNHKTRLRLKKKRM